MKAFDPAYNFTGNGSTYDTTYRDFGITVKSNYDSALGRYMKLSEHIQDAVEMGAGAHYYSHGKFTSMYKKAETTIYFKNVTTDTKNRRVACLSLGVIGAYGSCDMGIESRDGGKTWFPHYWCKQGNAGDDGTALDINDRGIAKVVITVVPSQKFGYDYVTGTFVWYGSDGSVKYEHQLTCRVTQNTIFSLDTDGVTTVQRFHRFMSLIPDDKKGLKYEPQYDTADGSTLKATLSDNKLYTTSGSVVTWGTSLMDYIWSVQTKNIVSFTAGNNDTISISHSKNVYSVLS